MEQKELQKAAETAAFIKKEIARLRRDAGESGDKVRERNRTYMAEHPFGSVYGDSQALVQENEKTIAAAVRMRAEASLLEQVLQAPYFGRVDFTYADDGEAEEIYVGLKTLVEDRRFLVYDWRAPISALFYFGELGKASYTAPAGEIGGEITRLRQFTFKNGELKNYWDAQLHIDDAVLTEVLSGRSGEEMKPIVYTIQREQNAAIRFDPNRNLAVFGPAGCGKTAVGMHRLAWLMYTAHTAGKSVNALMFTANEAFGSYVSAVLPALGEVNAESVSFNALFERFLPEYRVETMLSQTDSLLRKEAFRPENVRLLYAPEFADHILSQTAELPVRFKNVFILEDLALSAEVMERKFRALPARVPVKRRLDTLASWVTEELENYFLIHRKALLQTLLDRSELGESYTQQYFRLRRRVTEESRAMVLGAVPADPARLLVRFFTAFYGETPYTQALRERLAAKEIYFEDAAALLYLSVCLGECALSQPTHILIDEAQDYSLLLHRIIRALYPKAVFTVLSDPNQGVVPAANVWDAPAVARAYGAVSLSISKSYRSTEEIGAYAKRFLPPDAPDYELFRRSGPAPAVCSAKDPAAAAAEALADASRRGFTACVLLPTPEEAAAFYKKLKKHAPDCAFLSNERQTLPGGPVCMPAALAKGLEFDCVLLPLDASALPEDRLLYLMCTRAMHELRLFFTGPVPERFR